MSYTLYLENGAQRKALVVPLTEESSEPEHQPSDGVRLASGGNSIVMPRGDLPADALAGCTAGTLAILSPSGTSLLTLPATAYMVSSRGSGSDRRVALAAVTDGGDGELNATYTALAEDAEAPEPQCAAKNIRLITASPNSLYLYDDEPRARMRRVNIVFGNHRATVGVQIARAEQVYRVVIDFGSEASQVLVQRHNAGSASEPVDLFTTIASEFFSIQPTARLVYDQQDADDTRLFRSRFFSLDKFSENDVLSVPSPSDRSLRIITGRDDPKKGTRIANVKVSYLSGHYEQMSTFYRGIIMRLVHAAMRVIHADTPREPVAVELNLLLPNVMDQQSVAALVSDISRDCNSLHFKMHGFGISLVDVTAYSESDASLLEWLNKQQPIKSGKYLIIDGGKGTVDFSIAEVTDGSHITPIYRNGFLGAGNAINYAIFKYLMDRIGGSSAAVLEKRMLDAEPAKRYQLEELIERYKRAYRTDKKNTRNYLQPDPAHLTPEKILDLITDMLDNNDFGTDNEIIKRMVVRIAHTIGFELLRQPFDRVVFTGRAFMFEPLREMVETILLQINPEAVIEPYDRNSAKRGCLYGPLCPITSGLQTMFVGQVTTINSLTYEPPLTFTEQDFDDFTRRPSQWLRHINTISMKGMNLFDKVKQFFKELFESDESLRPNLTHCESLVQTTATINVRALLGRGIAQTTYGPNTRILISGRQYVTGNSATLRDDVDYLFHFNGTEYVLRAPDQTIPLKPDASQVVSTAFVDASLFPYKNDFK